MVLPISGVEAWTFIRDPFLFPRPAILKRRILWVANLTWFRQEKAKTWRTSQIQITINGNFCVLKINFNLLNLQNTYKPLTNFSYREQSQRKGTSHNQEAPDITLILYTLFIQNLVPAYYFYSNSGKDMKAERRKANQSKRNESDDACPLDNVKKQLIICWNPLSCVFPIHSVG